MSHDADQLSPLTLYYTDAVTESSGGVFSWCKTLYITHIVQKQLIMFNFGQAVRRVDQTRYIGMPSQTGHFWDPKGRVESQCLPVFLGLPLDWGRVTMFDNLWHRGLWPSLPRPVNFTRSGAAEAEQGGGRRKLPNILFGRR